jgi:hypothetical protein
MIIVNPEAFRFWFLIKLLSEDMLIVYNIDNSSIAVSNSTFIFESGIE